MGRPIKKIFLGERHGGNVGGEAIASISVDTAGTGYTGLDGDPLTITAPDLGDGVQATGTIIVVGDVVTDVIITEAGSGYTSAPTVTAPTGIATDATFSAVLTETSRGVIACSAFVPVADGGSAPALGDILSQRATRTYRVTTTEGTGECQLVAAVPTAGQMSITATDSVSGTYLIDKLMNRTVIIGALGTGNAFAVGDKVKWGDTAILNDTVKISD